MHRLDQLSKEEVKFRVDVVQRPGRTKKNLSYTVAIYIIITVWKLSSTAHIYRALLKSFIIRLRRLLSYLENPFLPSLLSCLFFAFARLYGHVLICIVVRSEHVRPPFCVVQRCCCCFATSIFRSCLRVKVRVLMHCCNIAPHRSQEPPLKSSTDRLFRPSRCGGPKGSTRHRRSCGRLQLRGHLQSYVFTRRHTRINAVMGCE